MTAHTPWLDIHCDDRLGSRLGLALLLLLVLSQPLISYACGLCILLLVITAEEIDLIIIVLLLGLLWCLGRVDSELA